VYYGGSHAETDAEMAAVMDAGFCQQLDRSNWPKLSIYNERSWEWSLGFGSAFFLFTRNSLKPAV
jgi:hypothetical protein